MKTKEIVASTYLARNLAKLIEKVRISHRPLYVQKEQKVIVKITAVSLEEKTGKAFLSWIKNHEPLLSKKESSALLMDLKKVREFSALPPNPWE